MTNEFYKKFGGKTWEEVKKIIESKPVGMQHAAMSYEFSPAPHQLDHKNGPFNLAYSKEQHSKAITEIWTGNSLRLTLGGMTYRFKPVEDATNGRRLRVTSLDEKNRNTVFLHLGNYYNVAKNQPRVYPNKEYSANEPLTNTEQEYVFHIDVKEDWKKK